MSNTMKKKPKDEDGGSKQKNKEKKGQKMMQGATSEDWSSIIGKGSIALPFTVFATMYTTSFVLELVENWTDPLAATFFLLLLGILLCTGVRLSVYLFFLAAATAYELIWRFPDVPNHVNLAIYMNTLQLALAVHLTTSQCDTTGRRGTMPLREEFFRAMRPIMGLATFLTYFFAGFHKLNTDFFDHRVSCTNEFMKNLMLFYKIPEFDLSEQFVFVVSVVTVVWELGGAFALFFQRTQPVMLLYSLMMHLILAPCSFYDFSTMMFACFTIFLPPTYWKVYEDEKDLSLPGIKICRHVLYAASTILVGLTTWAYRPAARKEDQFRDIQFKAGQICCFFFFVLAWPILRRLPFGKLPPWQSFRWSIRPRRWVYPIFAVFIVHGMSNYLGLRTAGTFSMFSNLKTEGPYSNHLLLGSNPIKFWNFQDDIVFINEAVVYRNTIDNRQTMLKGVGYPLIEFQKKLLEWQQHSPYPIYMYFTHRNQCFESLDIAHDDYWVVERDWRHYLMDFRKIQMDDEPNRCRW